MADYDYWGTPSRFWGSNPFNYNYPYTAGYQSNPNYGYGNYPANYENYPYTATGNPTWTYEEVYWWEPGPFTGVGPAGYSRSDQDIQDEINRRMAANGRLNASDIQVSVNNCEVTLNGSVDSRRSKRLAEDIADSVFGVEDVHNSLKVNPQKLSGSRPQNLSEGEEVIGSRGTRLGTVKEIHTHDFVLNRPEAPDVHVPFSAIQNTSGNKVQLNMTSDQIDKQGWTHVGG